MPVYYTEEELYQRLAAARINGLWEAAQAVCPRCAAGSPVRRAIAPYDLVYEHTVNVNGHPALVSCEASAIHYRLSLIQGIQK